MIIVDGSGTQSVLREDSVATQVLGLLLVVLFVAVLHLLGVLFLLWGVMGLDCRDICFSVIIICIGFFSPFFIIVILFV